jgi:hypothetical protein
MHSNAMIAHFHLPSTPLDPIRLSNRASLPFPTEAASDLGSERCKRYDELLLAVDEAEIRFREFASIMGLWDADDDAPFAA